MNEFDLIRTFFGSLDDQRADTVLGIGDDAALLRPPAGQELVSTIDTMVFDVHFSAAASPFDLGWKSLAVSLSDIAAMGGQPAWALLALTLPEADASWLREFAGGWSALARSHATQLIGGDTTRGPLSITTQLTGLVPAGAALRRDAAQAGDLIYVTGTIGDAGLALLAMQDEIRTLSKFEKETVSRRLNRPDPRCVAGLHIRDIANACIDISDGLAADLGHILEASGVGATLHAANLPLSETLQAHLDECGGWSMPLTAGDDYELCITVAPDRQGQLEAALVESGISGTWVGMIDNQPGLRCIDSDGTCSDFSVPGYRHFA